MNNPKNQEKTLYQRYGGRQKLDEVISIFFQYALKDRQISSYFIQNVSDIAKLHRTFAQYIAGATGGPKQYVGRDLQQIHCKMVIKQRQFDVVWHYMAISFKDLGVDDDTIQDIKNTLYGVSHKVMNVEVRRKQQQKRMKLLKQKQQKLKAQMEKGEKQN